ncbi:protein-glutamate methylesterase/protein-glutamine glutaminase [Labrys wisconsinensis]|uniref:Protein-glutamate methylesterase/protein-glutamine glutaminase n=1 Tax=Labrys wisconsinensis TaxID=425677 RepID=A0ABU0JAQ4_9HYPH|nr:chemotaxis response regulator protein-glutamate methylesterase [Labrys wisconsinensis]MDQ0471352.1 two-component system chemotaxis response regulator CheB [Labrys wisconsinensis]
MSAATVPLAMTRAEPPVRVMVVDDAVVVRGLIVRWLTEAGGFDIVASHRTGRQAVDDIERADPDIVILDIEMPDMDGIEALPLILRKKRNCAVIMASTLTRRNAEISLKCLSLGALDYVPKPETNREVTTSIDFRREIVEKVRSLGRRAVLRRLAAMPGREAPMRAEARETVARAEAREAPTRAEGPTRPAGERPVFRASQTAAPAVGGFLARERAASRAAAEPAPAGPHAVTLRPFSPTLPRLLAIGASTGGPQALNTVLAGIAALIERVPVLITQHMPPTFTAILAEHLGRSCGKPTAEAVDGEAIRPGRVYVAPGGRHMLVKSADGHGVIALDDGPMINFCKPAVDPLFSSAARVFGGAVLGLVLTGMGSDGAQGAGDIVAAGGNVVAQDEATSVVWGMPGAVAQAGHCAALLPLGEIAPRLTRLFSGDRT